MIIHVENLVKRYKEVLALNHLNLSVKEGEIYGLLGPNGSGKTTAINCLLSLLTYETGSIKIFGEKMTPYRYDLKKQIGVVSQNPAVYNELSVEENIDYFCGLYIENKTQRKQLVNEAIEFVQLEEVRKFRPKKLSGGLLRRLNLACGIAHKPRLIILDEPTVAVDPQSRNNILEGIKRLAEQGSTVLYTTHYMDEVEMLCDRLSIMDKGKTLVTGTIEEIKAMSSIGETIAIEAFHIDESVIDGIRTMDHVVSVQYDQPELVIRMDRGANGLGNIIHYLETHKVETQRLTSKQPSLNDVFLEITGKELRDRV